MCHASFMKCAEDGKDKDKRPTGKKTHPKTDKMGHRGFGNLSKANRLVYFGLSPFEQRAFPFFFSKGIPNLLRKMRRQLFLVVPGVLPAFYIIEWSKKENLEFSRKNPEEFANDS